MIFKDLVVSQHQGVNFQVLHLRVSLLEGEEHLHDAVSGGSHQQGELTEGLLEGGEKECYEEH